VVDLAERLRAAVWVSPMSSRCSFPEDHPLFQGFLDPEEKSIGAALASYDLVVVLGAPVFTLHVFRGTYDGQWPPIYVVSDDPDVLARASRGVGIRSTIRAAVRGLEVAPVSRVAPAPMVRPAFPDGATVSAAQVFAVMARMLPPDAMVVEEAPSHRNIMHDHLPIRARHNGFLTMASGTLGYSLPAAVGAALARPDRRVVAVLGDGSSMYGVQALWTAARENLPITFVILDNSAYAALDILSTSDDKIPGTELGGIDFAALATSLGCLGVRASNLDEVRELLGHALVADGPTVIHVPVVDGRHTLY